MGGGLFCSLFLVLVGLFCPGSFRLLSVPLGGAWLEVLVNPMKQAQGISEQLKAPNAMEWGGRMNHIRAYAWGSVDAEIIYT